MESYILYNVYFNIPISEKEEENSGYEFAVNATLYKDDVFYNCIYLEGGFCVYTHVTTHVCLLSFPESIYNRKYDDED